MALLKVAFCLILLFARQQVQSGKDAFRISNTGDDTDFRKSQKANVLMVVQSWKTLHQTDDLNVKPSVVDTKDWTLGYLLAGKNKAQTCSAGPLPNPSPEPWESLRKIWPNIYVYNIYPTDADFIKNSWKNQGHCVEDSEHYKCGESDNEQGNCYYKQAEQLYKYGVDDATVLYRCQMPIEEHTVSTYVQQSLECLFKENGDKNGIKNIDPSTVKRYFSNNYVYLGCQSKDSSQRKISNLTPASRFINDTQSLDNQQPKLAQCYITRVGLCFQCLQGAGVSGTGTAYCTPDSEAPQLGDTFKAPGTYNSCNPKFIKTVPWNPNINDAVGKKYDIALDVSCYTNCDNVELFRP